MQFNFTGPFQQNIALQNVLGIVTLPSNKRELTLIEFLLWYFRVGLIICNMVVMLCRTQIVHFKFIDRKSALAQDFKNCNLFDSR